MCRMQAAKRGGRGRTIGPSGSIWRCVLTAATRNQWSKVARVIGWRPTTATASGGSCAPAVAGTAASAASAPRRALPAVVRKGLVGLRHAVDVVLALERAALLGGGVHQLVGEPLGHRLLAAVASELDQPADGEGAGAGARDLDRHPVGRAADAAGADLEVRGEGADRDLELLERILAGLLADDGERVVDDLLGDRLLAVQHHLVDDLLDQARAMDGVRLDLADGGSGAAGHRYFLFTPYCERAFLRSLTPAASSVPRTTL